MQRPVQLTVPSSVQAVPLGLPRGGGERGPGRDAALAAQRAELDPIRVVEAISSRKGGTMKEEVSHTTHDERGETT